MNIGVPFRPALASAARFDSTQPNPHGKVPAPPIRPRVSSIAQRGGGETGRSRYSSQPLCATRSARLGMPAAGTYCRSNSAASVYGIALLGFRMTLDRYRVSESVLDPEPRERRMSSLAHTGREVTGPTYD